MSGSFGTMAGFSFATLRHESDLAEFAEVPGWSLFGSASPFLRVQKDALSEAAAFGAVAVGARLIFSLSRKSGIRL